MAQIQGEAKSGVGVTSLAFTMGNTAAQAALLVRGALASGEISTIVDSAGGTWVRRLGADGAIKQWDRLGAAAGVTLVTVNFSGATDAVIHCSERDDIDQFDVAAYTEVGTSTAPSSGNTAVTAYADEIAFGTFYTFTGDAQSFAAAGGYTASTGTGLTAGHRATGASTDVFFEEKTLVATGAQAATATCTSSYVYAGIATYRKKAAGGGGSSSSALLLLL